MIGIYDCFGYGNGYDVSFEERYQLIKEAGFDCVMLWWSDQFGRGDSYKDDVRLARKAGLIVENLHAPVHEQNCLSDENEKGEHMFQSYLECMDDCYRNAVSTLVIHLPNDKYPLNDLGMKRVESLIKEAEGKNVRIAFENLNNLNNTASVLNTFHSASAGFCYDSCHHINYAPDVDLLGLYGDRLLALHLHDNGGVHNQHQLPFDGKTDWNELMRKIAQAGYDGPITLEPMNWDYMCFTIREFLKAAAERAMMLERLKCDVLS